MIDSLAIFSKTKKMKHMKLKYLTMLCSSLLLASCETGLESESPKFRVNAESTTYQVGQPVKFTFEGNADMVTFYSGEPTNQYEFKDGRTIDVADEGATLTFTSGVTGGSQADQLTFFASTDFNGDYSDLASVKAANWVDITDRFVFGSTATFTNSTTQDISGLLVPGKPIYFAYRYLTRPQETNGLARTWMIQGFVVKSNALFNEAQVTITDQPYAGFRIVDEEPVNAPSRSTITTTRVSLLGNVYKDPNDPIYDPENPIFDPANPIYDPQSHLYEPNAIRPTYVPYDPNSPYNDPETETWAVSAPIYIDEVDLGPDRSRALKGISNSRLEEYRYTYDKPGTYKAYFIAINASIEERKETVQEITITITP
jgi:plastocyanin